MSLHSRILMENQEIFNIAEHLDMSTVVFLILIYKGDARQLWLQDQTK